MPTGREARCVYCRRRPVADAWRPFCGERCKLLDLHSWVDGRYRVPGEETSSFPDAGDPDAAGDTTAGTEE